MTFECQRWAVSANDDPSPHSQVREDAAMMKLGPTLRWVPGYFNESLPRLAREEPSLTFLTIRLDGDAYWSTYEALTVLYPRLSPGSDR